MATGMAGTRRAADRCARCRHARLRHVDGGAGECAAVVHVPYHLPTGEVGTRAIPCGCPDFQEREN